MLNETNTIFFIKYLDVPANRKVSCVRLVGSIHPNKTEKYCMIVTAGGDVLNYPCITSTDISSITTTKILLNSMISTLDAMFITGDIKKLVQYYLELLQTCLNGT